MVIFNKTNNNSNKFKMINSNIKRIMNNFTEGIHQILNQLKII